MNPNKTPYAGDRYPIEIIRRAVWLYFRFTLSFRDVEEILASRGILVSHESIRQWTLKFGQTYAIALRHRQPRRRDQWHLDEVVLTIQGKHHDLWRAMDQDGYTLDSPVQSRRDKKLRNVSPVNCSRPLLCRARHRDRSARELRASET